ncbi:MAG: acyltransferase [Alphaproteobacteria bacterium]|nr:acyltransferase [Alphaproteobacteria bacterium]
MTENTLKVLEVGIREVSIGRNVRIVKPSNLYGCTIGDDCFIGPFLEIQKDVVFGSRTRVQSHSFICEPVTLGEDCSVGHSVMFINDPFLDGGPARGRRDQWRGTHIGANVYIGSNAAILPVRICDDVVIGAGAVVTNSITEPGVYTGNPARRLGGMNEQPS